MKFARYLIPGLLILCSCGGNDSVNKPEFAPADSSKVVDTGGKLSGIKDLTFEELPEELKYTGTFLAAKQWDDKRGENYLIIYRRGPKPEAKRNPDAPEGTMFAEFFAQHFIRNGNQLGELWHLYDFVDMCSFDLWIGILDGSVSVTDLDADGIAETTVVYSLSCRLDATPASMKLIMYEGTRKYALRGLMRGHNQNALNDTAICCADDFSTHEIEVNGMYVTVYGKYKNEKDFAGAPPSFLAYARAQWRKFAGSDQFQHLYE